MLFVHDLTNLALANLLLGVAGLSSINFRSEKPQSFWQAMIFLSYLAFNVCSLLSVSLYAGLEYFFYSLEFPAVYALCYAYAELSFSLAGETYKRKRRLFRFVIGAITVVWGGTFIYAKMTNQPYLGLIDNGLLGVPIGLVVFSFGLLFFAARERLGFAPYMFARVKAEMGEQSDETKAILTYLAAVTGSMTGALVMVLLRIAVLPHDFLLAIYFVINTFIIAMMMRGYLSYIEKRADLATKIVSIFAISIAAVFVMISLLQSKADGRSPNVVGANLPIVDQSLNLTTDQSGYDPKLSSINWVEGDGVKLEAAQPLDLPFDLMLSGVAYSKIWPQPNGSVFTDQSQLSEQQIYICWSDKPIILALCSIDYDFNITAFNTKIEGAQVAVVNWSENGADPAFQLVIFEDGHMRISVRELPAHNTYYMPWMMGVSLSIDDISNPVFQPPMFRGDRATEGFVLDLEKYARFETHQALWPIALAMLIVTLVALFLLRPYLQYLFVRPIEGIREGLKHVDDGNLEHRVAVNQRDEFADIAAGFNAMIGSLDHARHLADEQTDILESEIAMHAQKQNEKSSEELLSKDQQFAEKLNEAIENNLGDFDFQVIDLADLLAVSPRQLHRRVVAITGKTPAALMRSRRLAEAHRQLSAKALSVSEAAYAVGFRDVGYFSKLFQKQYGLPPSGVLNG